ncbi:MAG TPA: peptide ABC transporter substrate-binding protein [Firmicutes bacterium]|nr:peptide ABC transporter substrate-binding protein [Bacillota bacterium]
MKRLLVSITVLLLVASLIAGCSQPSKPAEKPAEKQPEQPKEVVLTYNDGTEPQYIDPAKATGVPDNTVTTAVFEGLTRVKGTEAVPGVAERWETKNNGLTWVFYLRKNAKWSNGDPVTAKDFVFSWRRVLDPATKSEYAYQLYYVKNAEKFNSGEIKDPSQVGVKALDDYTLEVTLESPCPYFTFITAFPTSFPVHEKTVKADPEGWASKPETYIGNGPFKMVKWEHKSKMEFVPNEYYWDRAQVKLDRLVFTLVEDESTELTMFEANQLDMTLTVPTAEVPRLRQEGKLRTEPILGTYYYSFNTTKKPTSDPRVRKALALAIDRNALIKTVLKDAGQVPAYAFVPFGMPDAAAGSDFRKVGGDYFKENIEEAKKLLKEAGYPDGKGLKVELLYNNMEGHKLIAEAIANMWKTNLGIEMTLRAEEWKVYLDSRSKLNYQVARAGWIADYMDAMNFLDMWTSASGNNDTGWKNKKYDDLIAKARKTADNAERIKILHDAEKLLMDEMIIMPIYFYSQNRLIKDYVKGYVPSPLNIPDFKGVYIQK